MKKLLLSTLVSTLAISSVNALDIPSSIYRADQAEEAITEAAYDETAIAYILFPEAIQPS